MGYGGEHTVTIDSGVWKGHFKFRHHPVAINHHITNGAKQGDFKVCFTIFQKYVVGGCLQPGNSFLPLT